MERHVEFDFVIPANEEYSKEQQRNGNIMLCFSVVIKHYGFVN